MPHLNRTRALVIVSLCVIILLFRYERPKSIPRYDVLSLKSVPEPPFPTGKGRAENTSNAEVPHGWMPRPEDFPVETPMLLPTSRRGQLYPIQHDFAQDTIAETKVNQKRRAVIKETFTRAWKGYKHHAWLHDEVSPVSGNHADPFCGWAATLVDSLDTLKIMDMDDEFDRAADEVSNIDFNICNRPDIPLFETNIRFLGGLLAAHDLSGGKKELLTKAVELGNMLLAAFDTPNRMPMTYYAWEPEYANKAYRASSMAVLAELGTLSMEFTRLAQLTMDNRYYDAVARVQMELEHFQSRTRLPGLWPIYIDASGCQTSSEKEGHCEFKRLASSPLSDNDTFTLGGKSDSAYEYLLKVSVSY